jgi:hypothetical protein
MAANSTPEQVSVLPSTRSQTPGPLIYRTPQPQKYISSGRISRRRRASSISALGFSDSNRQAILDEAIRRAHQTPPLDELPSLEDSISNSNLHLPDFSVEVASSLSSSACSTPSAAVFGIYPANDQLSMPSTIPTSTYSSQAPILDLRYDLMLNAPFLLTEKTARQ